MSLPAFSCPASKATEPERLTTHQAEDVSPAFSPDVMVSDEGLVKVLDFGLAKLGRHEWLDGVVNGDRRDTQLDFPAAAFGPSQRFFSCYLARRIHHCLGRSLREFNRSIYLLDLNKDLKPKAEPRQLTFSKDMNWSPTWTSNGQEIVLVSGRARSASLRRVKASRQAEPQPLPMSGVGSSWPAISRNGNRLAYQQDLFDVDIWRLPLSNSGTAAGPPARFTSSTRWDY